MTWVEILGIVVLLGIIFLESKRGLGLALFDAAGALIIVRLSLTLAPILAASHPIGTSKEAAQGYWLAIVFVILGVLVLLASKLLYQTTMLSLDALDPTLGSLLGIISGSTVTYIMLKAMALVSTQSDFGKNLVETLVYRQFVQFHWYHYIIHVLQQIGQD